MYLEALGYLHCPACRSTLTPQVSEIDATGELLTGTLTCKACANWYPIHQGIGDFLGPPQPRTPAQQTNEWPLTAWAYERVWRPFSLTLLSSEPFSYRRELPLITGWMDSARGGLYLDIACSNGLYARALARTMAGASGHVLGIDHALPMLLEARRRAREAGLRISYLRAEAQDLPICSGVAHGVAIGGSLNEIGDLDQCLNEVRRTLHREGRFVLMALVAARSRIGRLVQQAFAGGGIVFLPTATLIERLQHHELSVIAWQSHGIVVFAKSEVLNPSC